MNVQSLKGLKIVCDKYIPETREAHRQERKWAHRVMYRRYQRFKIKTAPMILMMGAVAYIHPNTFELIKRQVPPL